MLLNELCEKIELQPEMTDRVLSNKTRILENKEILASMELLFQPAAWDPALDSLHDLLGEDHDGSGILSCMLLCGLHTRQMYQAAGIPESIFLDTFRCFPRFINEHKTSYGSYAFDRDWWTRRQIAMKIFRLGELEYELPRSPQDNTIHIHIPSHADLRPESLAASVRTANLFLQRYFPEQAGARMICSSWMLSPALPKLLPSTSNLRRFQEAFAIKEFNADADDYKEWVFKNPDLEPDDFPEDTSLQRSMKQYVQKGGTIGVGSGWLIGF